jgi:hypothetical protein
MGDLMGPAHNGIMAASALTGLAWSFVAAFASMVPLFISRYSLGNTIKGMSDCHSDALVFFGATGDLAYATRRGG